MGAPLIRSDPFATVELLAAYLQVEIDPADLMATKALQGATDAIQSYTDSTISYVEDDVIKVDGSGTDTLLLPERPVVSVEEVIVNFDLEVTVALLPPGNFQNTEFEWNTDGMLFRRSAFLVGTQSSEKHWSNRRKSILVTYSHGYKLETTEIQRSRRVLGAAANTHIGVTGFNADTDELLEVVDLSTPADDIPPVSPILTAIADGYGIKVSSSTTGKSLLVSWNKFIPGLPADVEMVCVAVAARGYAQDGSTQESAGSYNTSYAGQPATLTVDEKRVLDKYKPARRK